jgi:hypothetical protein
LHLEPAAAHEALARATRRLRDTTDPLWPFVVDRELLAQRIHDQRVSLPTVGTRLPPIDPR